MSKPTPETLRVIDQSATAENPTRVHDVIIDGQIQKITFNHGVATELPYATGLKFMQDGFTVLEHDTDIPLKRPAATDETVRFRIGENEIVASYDELTDAAIKLRAASKPTGEKFIVGEFDRKAAITFLKGVAEKEAVSEDVKVEFGTEMDEDGTVGEDPLEVDMADLSAVEIAHVSEGAPATDQKIITPADFGPPPSANKPEEQKEPPAPATPAVPEKAPEFLPPPPAPNFVPFKPDQEASKK